jgi:hypothetical protein
MKLLIALVGLCSFSVAASAASLDGTWCNTGTIELEAGIRSVQCGAGTVGLTFSENEKEFRAAGVELLCGSEINPVFLPFHFTVIEGDLYTSGFHVGWLKDGSAAFTLGNPDFTTTDFVLRAGGAGELFYDEVTRDIEGWTINRNRGTFRKMPVGTRTCAGTAR